jgi:Ca2+-binding RTX toxin-like protein
VAVITGSAGSDNLWGTPSADLIDAAGGDDWLDGDAGADTLTGGAGSDAFVFHASESALDSITDFVSAVDKLVFDNNGFTAIGAPGAFAAGDGRFAAGPGLTSGRDADDRVIYDSLGGNLYYDADGSGAGLSRFVASLQGAPALAATDIQVVGLGGVEIIGGIEADYLVGTPYADTIAGGLGADTIEGGAGADVLLVTAGDAIVYEDGITRQYAELALTPGSGVIASVARAFGEQAAGGGVQQPDAILDFDSADELLFEASVLPGLGGAGTWADGDARFNAGPGFTSARDASDRLVYDSSVGNLYYDSDGGGGAEAQLLLTLHGAPTLAAADITVI